MSIFRHVCPALLLAVGFWGCQSSVQPDDDSASLDVNISLDLPVLDSATYPDSVRWKVGEGVWTTKTFVQQALVTNPFNCIIGIHLPAGVRTIVVEWYTGGRMLRTSNYQVKSVSAASKTIVVDSAALKIFSLERHVSYDAELVPLARYHYGEFISAFSDTITSFAADGSIWWGIDTANLQKLTGPLWIDRTVDIVVQARRPGKIGPKIWYNYVIRPKITFANADLHNQYNERSAIGDALKSAGVYGFGWSSQLSKVSQISKVVDVGSGNSDPYLTIAYTLQGDTTNVGVGLQIGGSVDSSAGSEKGHWGIDLSRMVRLRSVFRFSPALNDSLELVLQIASMDPAYGVSCAKGGCLRYAIKASEINNGLVDIPLDNLKYPVWYEWGSAPIPDRVDVLRRASGVVFLVGGVVGHYSKPMAGVLGVQSLEFVTGATVAASGMVRLP